MIGRLKDKIAHNGRKRAVGLNRQSGSVGVQFTLMLHQTADFKARQSCNSIAWLSWQAGRYDTNCVSH